MDLRNKDLDQLHELWKTHQKALARQRHEWLQTGSKAEYTRARHTEKILADIKAEIKRRTQF